MGLYFAAGLLSPAADRDPDHLAFVTKSPSAWETYGPEFGEARRLIDRGEYNKAATLLEALIATQPGPAHACLAYLAIKSKVPGKSLIIRRHTELALECGFENAAVLNNYCLLYTSPSPRDKRQSRMPSSA